MAVRDVDASALTRVQRRQAQARTAPWLHAEVARRMAERLPVIRLQPDTIVDWWAHAGASEAAFARIYPKARRLRVEASDVPRSAGRSSAPWWSLQHWRRETPAIDEAGVPAEAGQLLWANMMLHAVPDPAALMKAWRRALAVDGFLMFSTLGPDTLGGLRALYRDAGWGAAHAAFTDMHDLGDMLVAAGFADPVMDQERLTLTWATPEALLSELRTLGGNADPTRFAGLRTPRWRARLMDALRERAQPDGRIALGFELVYGHAFNPPPRPKMAGETRVPLDDLRSMVRSGRRPNA
ncbi:MAG TPA: methyltransferase domain-containing protein [Burkholderiaceae bacterium]